MQISVNKFLFYILFLIFLSNCSGIKKDIVDENTEAKDIFEKVQPITNELNPGLNIQLSGLTKEEVFLNNDYKFIYNTYRTGVGNVIWPEMKDPNLINPNSSDCLT